MQKRHEIHAKAGAPVFSVVVALARGKSRLETVTWRTSLFEPSSRFQASRDQAIATGNKTKKLDLVIKTQGHETLTAFSQMLGC